MSSSRVGYGRRVFIDTSAFFATIDRSDQRWTEATTLLERLVVEKFRLFTTNFVVAELHALVVARINRNVALTALTHLYQSTSLTVVRASLSDERRAWEIIARFDDKTFSLTDAISFAVMERLRISTAFSLDDDFNQYGWVVLRPAEN
jgi:predicted nucleic acid-binding protein